MITAVDDGLLAKKQRREAKAKGNAVLPLFDASGRTETGLQRWRLASRQAVLGRSTGRSVSFSEIFISPVISISQLHVDVGSPGRFVGGLLRLYALRLKAEAVSFPPKP